MMPDQLDYRDRDAPANSPQWVPQRVGHPRHLSRRAWGRIAVAFLVILAGWKIATMIIDF